ncbi:NFIL3 protein, partial [Atractosteus spatula]|nr:NFIL3 protein [Atractosteus spatula]
MPDEKKDASYWEKRRKNNEAAKRSREKRRVNDFVLESRLLALGEENAVRVGLSLASRPSRTGVLSLPGVRVRPPAGHLLPREEQGTHCESALKWN